MNRLIDPIRKRARDEHGAAIVETTLVLPVLLLLVLGGITFGLILGFRQTAEEAASEGARVAMITYANDTSGDPVVAAQAAEDAAAERANGAMSSWEPTCDTEDADGDGLGCWTYVHDCAEPIGGRLPEGEDPVQTAAEPDCITVVIHHDYGARPFLPEIPLLEKAMPDVIATAATVQLNTNS